MVLAMSFYGLSGIRVGAPVLAASLSDLTIIQFKMTGSESIVIQNTSANVISLKNYWLEYYNKSNPTFPTTASNSQQLPDYVLATGQTALLSGDSAPTCGASVVANLSFSLSDTSGYVRLTKVAVQPDGVSTLYTPLDHVSWTSTITGADLVKVPSNTADPLAVWYRSLSSGTWTQTDLNGTTCGVLNSLVSPGSDITYTQLAQASAGIPFSVGSATAGNSIPSADAGLAAPKLSEILPNPAPPQTDADDEFIELYNSNSKAFDLSGFMLQVGISTTHKYSFPDGTLLQPQQFGVYYASETGLSLSNSNGQVKLLDPAGNTLEQSDAYSTAKDGYAWVTANGLWQWTTTPTPAAKNVITAPPAKSSKSQSSGKTVLAAKTADSNNNGPGGSPSGGTKSSPLHPAVLAGIGAIVLLYALYEYRHDLANQFYRLRRNRKAGGVVGRTAEPAASFRTFL